MKADIEINADLFEIEINADLLRYSRLLWEVEQWNCSMSFEDGIRILEWLEG